MVPIGTPTWDGLLRFIGGISLFNACESASNSHPYSSIRTMCEERGTWLRQSELRGVIKERLQKVSRDWREEAGGQISDDELKAEPWPSLVFEGISPESCRQWTETGLPRGRPRRPLSGLRAHRLSRCHT